MARNLITGGMGFLGVYVARQLLADGEEVVLFQRRSELPPSAADLEGKVEILSGDIGNWVHVVEAITKHHIDSIYHSAALLGKECEESAASGFRVNVIGTFNVLEAARLTGVKDVTFVSTGATYGLTPPRKIFNDTPQKAENMHTATKICGELLGNQYHRLYGVNFRGVRYAMIVGPTRQISYYYGDWSGVIEMTAKGKPYTVHSDPNIPCAYIYVKDAARALIVLKRAPESKLRQRIYNAHGFMATLNEVAQAITHYIPHARITFDWDRSEYMKLQNSGVSYEMDNSTAHEDFGYQPEYLLDSMIRDFIKEVEAGRAG
jgi:nucleoside-diphosphate-sugar epimerase